MHVNADSLLIRAATKSTSGTFNDLTTNLIMANSNKKNSQYYSQISQYGQSFCLLKIVHGMGLLLLFQKVLRRATELLPQLKDLDYMHRLNALKLPSLQYIKQRGNMIETLKIITGRVDWTVHYSSPLSATHLDMVTFINYTTNMRLGE